MSWSWSTSNGRLRTINLSPTRTTRVLLVLHVVLRNPKTTHISFGTESACGLGVGPMCGCGGMVPVHNSVKAK